MKNYLEKILGKRNRDQAIDLDTENPEYPEALVASESTAKKRFKKMLEAGEALNS